MIPVSFWKRSKLSKEIHSQGKGNDLQKCFFSALQWTHITLRWWYQIVKSNSAKKKKTGDKHDFQLFSDFTKPWESCEDRKVFFTWQQNRVTFSLTYENSCSPDNDKSRVEKNNQKGHSCELCHLISPSSNDDHDHCQNFLCDIAEDTWWLPATSRSSAFNHQLKHLDLFWWLS